MARDSVPSAFFFSRRNLTFGVSGVDYMTFWRIIPFLKRLRVMLTGIRSVSFFRFRAWLSCVCVVLYGGILSETGVGPVPILPVVSHMFPPAFLCFELGNRKKAVFEEELAKIHKFPIQTAAKHIKGWKWPACKTLWEFLGIGEFIIFVNLN